MLSLCVSGCLGGIHGKFHLPLNQPAFVFFGQLEKEKTKALKALTVMEQKQDCCIMTSLLEAVNRVSLGEKWAITMQCFRPAEGSLTGSCVLL